jgi:hypothetical protein
MHSNGAVSHGDQGMLPMPPALTQRVRPLGGDGSSLPLEPFRFLRGLPANRLAFAAAQAAEPEPVELSMFSEEPLPLDEPLDLGEPLHLEEPLALDEPLELAEPFQLTEPLQLADAIVAEDAAQAAAVNEPVFDEVLQLTEAPSDNTEHELETARAQGAAHELAERLEQLSRRLRDEQLESLLPSLAGGDRFDALVAGFLAGYFSAKDA